MRDRAGSEGRVVAARVADHIKPHHNDPTKFWFGKLQSLCTHCRESRKQFEESCGFDRTIGIDGWPTDLRHLFYQYDSARLEALSRSSVSKLKRPKDPDDCRNNVKIM